MAKGIDRAVPFKTRKELDALYELGYTFICRYLTRYTPHWKALSKSEASLISSAGMYVVCVYQDSSNRADYFSYMQGKIDAGRAAERAEQVGMPDDGVIYFAVDYDTSRSVSGVIDYFKGVRDGLKDTKHKIGVYGSYNTCIKVPASVPEVTHKWQTIAWSKGRKCDYNLYQYKIDTYIPENRKMTGYDLNLSNGNGGGWKV